jgi:hypothetical protein
MTTIDRETAAADVLNEKLSDAEMSPGFEVEFDPEEADRAGAFEEDALSEADALASSVDWVGLG